MKNKGIKGELRREKMEDTARIANNEILVLRVPAVGVRMQIYEV